MVEQRGIEPLTSALRTRRSAKLSYCPTRISILGRPQRRVNQSSRCLGLCTLYFVLCTLYFVPGTKHQHNRSWSRGCSRMCPVVLGDEIFRDVEIRCRVDHGHSVYIDQERNAFRLRIRIQRIGNVFLQRIKNGH
jgi:hypothetical protein